MSAEAEVVGVVSSIISGWTPTTPNALNVFNLYFEDTKTTATFTCKFFFPIAKGDSVYALFRTLEDGTHEITDPPIGTIASDTATIKSCLTIALSKCPGVSSHRIFGLIAFAAGGEANVDKWLMDLGVLWYKEHDPGMLETVEGVTSAQMKDILIFWNRKRIIRRLYLLGINDKEIKDSDFNPIDLYEKILYNPYTVPSLTTERCRSLLKRLDREDEINDINEFCGKVLRFVWKHCKERGYSCTPASVVNRHFPGVGAYNETLTTIFDLTLDMEFYYLSRCFAAETKASQIFIDKITLGNETQHEPIQPSIDLTDDQLVALDSAINNPVTLITGGAGTGKTTLIKELIRNVNALGKRYLLTSFTGKAVSRIREVTGLRDPKTMHLIIAMLSMGHPDFYGNYDYIIIDEISMVTTELFVNLVTAVPSCTRLILVGDVNQLPPIEWGSLMKQCMISHAVPTHVLSFCHRVSDKSASNAIMLNAAKIVAQNPNFYWEESENFILCPGGFKELEMMITTLKESGVIAGELTVLTPYNKSQAGMVDSVNTLFQSLYNPKSKSITDSNKRVWKISDRVMLNKNDPTIGVYNGEEGIIVGVDYSKREIKVNFKGSGIHGFRTDVKPFAIERDVSSLELSYCMSIHKSQGSEWNYVIIYVPPECKHSSFVNCELVYTGITRSKDFCCLIGNIDVLTTGAQTKAPYRCENLSKRLLATLEPSGHYKGVGQVVVDDDGYEYDMFDFD